MICKIGTKLTTLATLTCKLATVNLPGVLSLPHSFYTVPVLASTLVITLLAPRKLRGITTLILTSPRSVGFCAHFKLQRY